jgi:transcriptional regulator with XRE-family HTH domain
MPDEPIPGLLGQKIQELREHAGFTLYQLEARSGIPRSRLLRLENGTTRQPTQATLTKLAQALDVDPEDFYDAVWQDATEPLPSLTTYFRSKFHFSDEQIAVMQQALNRAETKDEQPGGSKQSPAPNRKPM